jgi:hypothetical protein
MTFGTEILLKKKLVTDTDLIHHPPMNITYHKTYMYIYGNSPERVVVVICWMVGWGAGKCSSLHCPE